MQNILEYHEQVNGRRARLSGILWDMFSGSAPYSDIFRRMLDPILAVRGAIAMPAVLVSTARERLVAPRRPSARPGR